jgi:hypothetical protein
LIDCGTSCTERTETDENDSGTLLVEGSKPMRREPTVTDYSHSPYMPHDLDEKTRVEYSRRAHCAGWREPINKHTDKNR